MFVLSNSRSICRIPEAMISQLLRHSSCVQIFKFEKLVESTFLHCRFQDYEADGEWQEFGVQSVFCRKDRVYQE